jgi:hypothetical protein
MKKAIGLLFKFLATGTFTLFIAACYGLPWQWKKITARSPASTGIPGLQVTIFDHEVETGMQTSTDADGVAMFGIPAQEGMTAVIVDVDGLENGGSFAPAEIVLDSRNEYDVTMTCTSMAGN